MVQSDLQLDLSFTRIGNRPIQAKGATDVKLALFTLFKHCVNVFEGNLHTGKRQYICHHGNISVGWV